MTADLYSWTEQEEEVRENLRVGAVTVKPTVSILQREQQDCAVFSPRRFCPSILNSEFYSVCIASSDLWRNRGLSLESLLWSPRAAVPPLPPSNPSLSPSIVVCLCSREQKELLVCFLPPHFPHFAPICFTLAVRSHLCHLWECQLWFLLCLCFFVFWVHV